MIFFCVALILFLVTSWRGFQVLAKAPERAIATDTPLKVVNRSTNQVLQLSRADFASIPHRQIQAKSREGEPVTYTGVPLVELLRLAAVPLGNEQLRGKNLALYVLVEGADNLRVVFSLAELDPSFSDRVVLLADQVNGQPLPSSEGDLRLIVPGEKRFSRWVKQVTQINVLQAA
jgi:DMSO/TMAO reductase YedYZ molybdopterin-dependent catalytic subunit